MEATIVLYSGKDIVNVYLKEQGSKVNFEEDRFTVLRFGEIGGYLRDNGLNESHVRGFYYNEEECYLPA